MPTVEKTRGGRVYIRPLEQEFEIGDTVGVETEMAAYLTEERGDFVVVDVGRVGVVDESGDENELEDEAKEAIEILNADPMDVAEELADDEDAGDEEVCGVEMSDGDTCERPADECPYHGDDAED